MAPSFTVPRTGRGAVVGAFGLPAIIPESEVVSRLVCPSRMVLGEDDLCYPKAVLRRDSRFRKHRPGRRPLLTGGERNIIRKADALVDDVQAANKALGLKVPVRKRKKKK